MKDDIVTFWNEMTEEKQRQEQQKTPLPYMTDDWLLLLMFKEDTTGWPTSSEDDNFQNLLRISRLNSEAALNLLKLLEPEDRRACLLRHLENSTSRRIDMNLYSELDECKRGELLQKNYLSILNTFFSWTSQNVFISLANDFFYLFDKKDFRLCVTDLLFRISRSWLDLSYVNLFKQFWNSSPIHLREALKAEKVVYSQVMRLLDGSFEVQLNSVFESLDEFLANPTFINKR
ncbi:hypothetical protein CDAR_593741 [Caerostris darwini]|uniref:Uncharacterized protein n=1 Tax=Caerostris darwini TaxID=1538125 RepID=A0AAV4TW92_9ARAC|nr:hypothetical protein CDAR_593741 [Caerostris darwini]